MNLTGWLINVAINLIEKAGYIGISVGLVLDSCGIPIPSEVILALSGSLAKTGVFNFFLLIVIGTIAQTIGAYLSYLIGKYGGEPLINKYGKFLLISPHDLQKAIRWFDKRGEATVFISRLVPVIRTYIGFAAGIFKMKQKKFVIDTFFGSLLWSIIFISFGYLLGDSWKKYYKYLHYLDYLIIVAITFFIIRFIYKKLSKKKSNASNN